MNGTLERTDDGPRLRFTRRLAHPGPHRLAGDHRARAPEGVVPGHDRGRPLGGGAPLRFDGFEGEVLAVEPHALLEFRWGTDTIRIELEPDGEGTALTLLDTFDELGKAARDGAGWHVCLDQLEHELDGNEAPWSSEERWKAVHPGYVEEFPPEASTIGPPSG